MTRNIADIKAAEELLRKLVAIQSPYFHEEEVMDFVLDWLQAAGLPAQLHTFYEGRETHFHGRNVHGCLDSGKPGPVIYLNGHLDTVRLCEGWTRPPYEGVVEDGKMYGVGALDMKGGDAAILLALQAFARDFGSDFCGKIIYHFVSDEEGPFGLGTVFLIADDIDGIRSGADLAIIAEPSAAFASGGHPCFCLGARGGYNFTVTLHGTSAHAALPELGVNAVTEAAKVMLELEKIEPAVDEKLGPAALCVIDLKTRPSACSVPDWAQIEVFEHTVRGESVETIRAQVEEAIRRADIRSSWEIAFRQPPVDDERFDGGFVPYVTDEENPYILSLEASAEAVCGRKPSHAYNQSIGDFNSVGGLLGIPTVLLGPSGERFHSADEYVELQDVADVANILYDFLAKTNGGRK
ncbi:MAG: M20/M25/M40 family metallo-hydrolase [Firmicutes bacterium]|nr:M20/M25/M40 family metallo-hydrolase [Bacillota bacterium]